MLKTVFFEKDSSPFYRKAIVATAEVDFFLRNGASLDCEEVVVKGMAKEKAKAEVNRSGKKD